MSAESDFLAVVEPAATYMQYLGQLEHNKVTGPGITLDLVTNENMTGYLQVTKEE